MRRSSTSFVGCLVVSILLSSLFIWISLCLFQLAISDDCQSCWWWRHERHFASCYIRTEGSFSHQTFRETGPKSYRVGPFVFEQKKRKHRRHIQQPKRDSLNSFFTCAFLSLSSNRRNIFRVCKHTAVESLRIYIYFCVVSRDKHAQEEEEETRRKEEGNNMAGVSPEVEKENRESHGPLYQLSSINTVLHERKRERLQFMYN